MKNETQKDVIYLASGVITYKLWNRDLNSGLKLQSW
jgi:hypothetical protein